jgi:hypothetical protein
MKERQKSTMSKSPSSTGYNYWTEPSYEVKIRGPMREGDRVPFLWGSDGIKTDITFDKPLVLHIHNDLFGEVITFGTKNVSGTQETIGTLHPGEFVSIPLQGISGVFATCDKESTVCCLIK